LLIFEHTALKTYQSHVLVTDMKTYANKNNRKQLWEAIKLLEVGEPVFVYSQNEVLKKFQFDMYSTSIRDKQLMLLELAAEGNQYYHVHNVRDDRDKVYPTCETDFDMELRLPEAAKEWPDHIRDFLRHRMILEKLESDSQTNVNLPHSLAESSVMYDPAVHNEGKDPWTYTGCHPTSAKKRGYCLGAARFVHRDAKRLAKQLNAAILPQPLGPFMFRYLYEQQESK